MITSLFVFSFAEVGYIKTSMQGVVGHLLMLGPNTLCLNCHIGTIKVSLLS